MADFTYEALPSRVIFGPGCAARHLNGEIDRLGAHRVLLVVSQREAERRGALIGSLGPRVVGTFTGVRPHVPSSVVDEVVALAAEVDADAVLSIGGGSTTGTAKALALHTSLPIIAVPTTYAGSEMTPVWGVTTDSRKTTGHSSLVLAKTVLYDRELSISLPRSVSVTSAMNAMAHCVEALYVGAANPISSLIGVGGVRAIATGIPRVVADIEDQGGRDDLLYGAYLAGSALAGAGSGLHHKICHVLGGAFDLPHADTHTVLLAHVTAFNEPACLSAMAPAAAALDSDTVTAGLVSLTSNAGAPTSLGGLGMTEESVEAAVELLMDKDLTDNPRPVAEEDLRRILNGALYGDKSTL